MIIGVGTDIVKVARFEEMTTCFMERVFTLNERAYLYGKSHISAAGLFAAKEAVAKALGTGFRGFWPDMIEITHDVLGKPEVKLHGEAACAAMKQTKSKCRFYRRYVIELSISHTDENAVAFAVICLK